MGFWLLLAFAAFENAGGSRQVIPAEYRGIVHSVLGTHVVQVLAIAGPDDGRRRTRAVISFLVLSLAGFFTGMLEFILKPLILYVALEIVQARRMPVLAIGSVVAAAFLLNPVKLAYRQIAWNEAGSKDYEGLQVTAEQWGEAWNRSWGSSGALETATETAESRLNELPIVARTIQATPNIIPFDHFSGWLAAPFSPIPRFLWPEKPNFTSIFNDRFAVTFGFIETTATETMTFSMPLVAEGYWGFGWIGVCLVGAVLGVCLGAWTAAFPITTWPHVVFAAALFDNLRISACLFSQVGGLFHMLVGTALVVWGLAYTGRMRIQDAGSRRRANSK
jgi:hypothetical protein